MPDAWPGKRDSSPEYLRAQQLPHLFGFGDDRQAYTFNVVSQIEIANSTTMTPAVYNGRIYIANFCGALNIYNLENVSEPPVTISTDAVQPILGLSLSNDNALFLPITGAAAPLILLNSNLYYGNSNDELVVADSMSGAIRTSICIIPKLDSFYKCYYHL